jgi:mRNA interferase HigB
LNITGHKRIKDFATKHATSRKSLITWQTTLEVAHWKNPTEVAATFNTADCVKEIWIFNIGANNYRLAATIDFETETVHILKLGTHA